MGFALVLLAVVIGPLDAGAGALAWLPLTEDLISVSEPLWYKILDSLADTPP